MDRFLQAETVSIELLLVASLVAIGVRRLRIPYTVALVVVGLLITARQRPAISLTSDLLLALFVPPLVFEAAFHLPLASLRRGLPAVLLLAVPGVIATMFIVGGLVGLATPLGLGAALVFGALISATDPVAVVATFRALGVPRRLSVLVESESLLNDGTAIVVYNLALAAALTGGFDPIDGAVQFVSVSAGGVIIGLGLGWIVSQMIAHINDALIETTLTTVLAFGSYLLADRLGVSGVLAVVAAGVLCGNVGTRAMSPSTRIMLFNFWEFAAFLANSFVFLLIGLEVNLHELFDHWSLVAWAVAAVLLARVVVVYGLGWAAGRLTEPLPLGWLHVLNWGGLRGAVSLALALSLPAALGRDQELLRVMAFGVVLFLLLVQGLTIAPLVRWLGLAARPEAAVAYEMNHARLAGVQAAEERLDELHAGALLSSRVWSRLRPALAARREAIVAEMRGLLRADPSLAAEELERTTRDVLSVQRAVYQSLRRDGVISDEAFDQLTAELDAALDRDEPLAPMEREAKPRVGADEPRIDTEGDVTRNA